MESKPETPTAVQQKPNGFWGTVLTVTPIVMTVLATVFAGLSSSEMTKSMYYRSFAAQMQSKVGDQWSFFQAKRIRGSLYEVAIDVIEGQSHPEPFDLAQIETVTAQVAQLIERGGDPNDAVKVRQAREKITKFLADSNQRQGLVYLAAGGLPSSEVKTPANAETTKAIDAVFLAMSERKSNAEISPLILKLNEDMLDDATRIAEQNADRFEKACDPTGDAAKRLRGLIGELGKLLKSGRTPTAGRDAKAPREQAIALVEGLNTSFKSALLDFDSRRYRQDAAFNRRIAEINEVRVRLASVESDRRRERSVKFFISMLLAQMGVTVASLALARSQHSVLWVCAASAGVAAMVVTGYGYLLT